MTEITSKVEERTPYVIVAFQECQRMNYLTNEIKRSLKELDLGLKVSSMYNVLRAGYHLRSRTNSLPVVKGELTITSDMEDLENALFLDQVPATWTQRAYPSLLGLSAWFADLLLRIRELENWSTDFVVREFCSLISETFTRESKPRNYSCLRPSGWAGSSIRSRFSPPACRVRLVQANCRSTRCVYSARSR